MNRVVLGVAGSRKTQSIVDACADKSTQKRRLVLTFTSSAQNNVDTRLRRACSKANQIPAVSGWYAFLLHHWVRPYLPLLYSGRRLSGLNFEAKSTGVDYASGEGRFLDAESRAYKRHLSKLACDVAEASRGGVIDRLEHILDEIYVDEVQDLTGYDLVILEALLRSKIAVILVGDVRQSLFNTNPQDPMNRHYRDLKMLNWFALQKKKGLLVIEHLSETWRCNQAIATFSDTIFPPSHGFPPTVSKQIAISDHDGIFVVALENVAKYIAIYDPLCLRYNDRTRHPDTVNAINFGLAKGLTVPRVLIFPTGPIGDFLLKGKLLADKSAFGLYVGVTRAVHSVTFVVDRPSQQAHPVWTPPAG